MKGIMEAIPEEEIEIIQPEINPLLIDLVLHRMLSYCNLEDLKTCRVVNTKWDTESSLHLRKKSKIHFTHDFISTLNTNPSTYRQVILFQPENLSFSETHVDFDQNHNQDQDTLNIIQNLVYDLHNSIKYLHFIVSNWISSAEIFQSILTTNLTHLFHLSIDFKQSSWPWRSSDDINAAFLLPIPSIIKLDLNIDCKSRNQDRANQLANLHQLFTKIAPNLESLSILSKWKHEFYYNNPIPPQNNNINTNPVNTVLEYFNLYPTSCPNLNQLELEDVTDLDISALSELNLKLISLKISPSDRFRITDFQVFEKMLKKQQNTLETLEFEICDAKKPTCVTLPVLSKLKKLTILIKRTFSYGCEEFGINMTFAKIDYRKQFPALEKLTICPISYHNGFKVDLKVWTHSKVYEAFFPVLKGDEQICKTLRILKVPYSTDFNQTDETLDFKGFCERLSVMFPNVSNQSVNSS